MKKIALATTALVLMAGSAFAADLSPRTYTKAPAFVAAYNWTGLYVGAQAGYGWANSQALGATNVDVKGGFVGGTVGYNWQLANQWVLGLEADAAWADLSASTVGASSKINAIGTVAGRVGYSFDRTLVFVKGGYAWANNEVSVVGVGSQSKTHNGWTIGAGVEQAIAGNWSVKGEYQYASFNKETYAGLVNLGADVHTVKAGLNYRFNGF